MLRTCVSSQHGFSGINIQHCAMPLHAKIIQFCSPSIMLGLFCHPTSFCTLRHGKVVGLPSAHSPAIWPTWWMRLRWAAMNNGICRWVHARLALHHLWACSVGTTTNWTLHPLCITLQVPPLQLNTDRATSCVTTYMIRYVHLIAHFCSRSVESGSPSFHVASFTSTWFGWCLS